MKKTLLLFTTGAIALVLNPVQADDGVLPNPGFASSHYETLWTKSPFSVATPDAPDSSPDYTLVGITQLDGVAYASVVDSHTQDHFVISTEKAIRGLKLVSITHPRGGTDTFASVEKDGQPLSLKLQSAPVQAPGQNPVAPGQPQVPMPGVPQNIPMPMASQPGFPGVQPGMNPGSVPVPRSIRVHRPLIHLPPQPVTSDANAPQPAPQGGAAPATPDSVQSHNPPPQ